MPIHSDEHLEIQVIEGIDPILLLHISIYMKWLKPNFYSLLKLGLNPSALFTGHDT